MKNQLHVIGPALVLAGIVVLSLLWFTGLVLTGRRPHNPERRNHGPIFHYLIDFFMWFLRPVERRARALNLEPNHITMSSLFVCMSAGLAIATDHLATAGWLYILAGALDILDGRLARARGLQSRAGAFLDSVTDRWCELFIFAGFAWNLRDSTWLLAVMLAITGSLMTSYTRARGEALGIKLDGGTMQRPERITIVSIGCLITAWFNSAESTVEYGPHVLGVCLLVVGLGASATAIGRWYRGFQLLRDSDLDAADAAAADEEKVRTNA